jgi:signal transduction histidine kinase
VSEVGRQATSLGTDNDPDAPQLSLDGLLRQLVSQAEDVMAAHERLRALLAATEFLLGTAEIPVALRRITEAARSLVGAGYAGLGILTPSGEALDRIVTADGAEPRPLPLPPRTCRGPELHVPLYVRNRLFGYLHLSDGPAAGFTADDEEVVTALAATGGVVIENAQLFDEAQRRQRWLEASGSVTRQLLAAEGEDPLTLIAREARVLADADVSSVVRPAGADGERLVVAVASGLQERELRGVSFDAATSLSGRALTEGRPVLVTDAAAQLPMDGATVSLSPVGPAMALPLRGTSALLGTLVLARNRGRRPFDAGDLEMATAFASQAAVAVELADARADQHRMAVLEDRDRIARTLHDQVIQRLFATGLSVQGIAGRVPETEDVQGHQNRLHRVVSDIDDTIRQIRTSVFELESGGSPGSARSRLLAVVADAERVLPVSPSVIIDEGVELLAGSEALLSDVVAVLREGLTNVARHARATAVDVQVRMVDRSLQVQLTDDGIGIGASGRRSGLGNLRQRALARRGTLVVGPAPESGATSPARPGTRLVWTVPVT